jgi:hypothetical protein
MTPAEQKMGIRRALRMALATIELHTGDGCQNSRALVKDAHGDVDYETTARMIRATLAPRRCSK